jgi:hypothetical protein
MNAPNGAQAPKVNHDLLNDAVPQVPDTHEAYDAAGGVLFHIATMPVEAAVLGRLGGLASGAIAARRIGLPVWGKSPSTGYISAAIDKSRSPF